MPTGLATVAVEAEDPRSAVEWRGSPGGAWWHWHLLNQMCPMVEVACSRAVLVRRTKVRVPSSMIIRLHFQYIIK